MFDRNNHSYVPFESTIEEKVPDNSEIYLKELGFFSRLFNSQATKVIEDGNKFPYQYKMLYKVQKSI